MTKFEKIIKSKLQNYEYVDNNMNFENIKNKIHNKKSNIISYFLKFIFIFYLVVVPSSINNNIFKNQKIIKNKISNESFKSTPDLQDQIKDHRIYENFSGMKSLNVNNINFDSQIKFKKLNKRNISYDINIDTTEITDIIDTINKDTISTEIKDTIIKSKTPIIYFATAFTPDGDGLNDTFFPIGNIDNYSFQLLIYNRYGELIFESLNKNVPWCGKNAESGIYVYVFRIQLDDGEWITKTGIVNLIK